jgi:hypothetical protein
LLKLVTSNSVDPRADFTPLVSEHITEKHLMNRKNAFIYLPLAKEETLVQSQKMRQMTLELRAQLIELRLAVQDQHAQLQMTLEESRRLRAAARNRPADTSGERSYRD